MVKFSEVRKTYEASKYVPYWRKVGGIKAPSVVGGGGTKTKDGSSSHTSEEKVDTSQNFSETHL